MAEEALSWVQLLLWNSFLSPSLRLSIVVIHSLCPLGYRMLMLTAGQGMTRRYSCRYWYALTINADHCGLAWFCHRPFHTQTHTPAVCTNEALHACLHMCVCVYFMYVMVLLTRLFFVCILASHALSRLCLGTALVGSFSCG